MDLSLHLAALPVEQRLALAYSPASARPATLAALALDTRLAGVVLSNREPVLAQLRLAWWRDRFAMPKAQWPEGEPLLQLLRGSGIPGQPLVGLVNGWERLLSDDGLDAGAMGELVAARSDLFAALGERFGASKAEAGLAARQWAFVDIAARLSDRATKAQALPLDWRRPVLPRALRTLAVLSGLARRNRHRIGTSLIAGPGAMLAVLRMGMLGR